MEDIYTLLEQAGKISKAFLVALAGILCAGLALYLSAYAQDTRLKYVRGEYGGICYPRDKERSNIKYPIYYQTLAECQAAIKI